MKFVLNNPYRIVGILANASAREIQARKGKISAYAKVGKEITSEYDLPFFNSIERTTALIDKAFSDIEQNQNKVFHSLFWFTNLNPIDNTAIQHLVSGNKEKALEIWDKLTDEKEITSKNFSAFNNIGTLYLLDESKEEIKKGITLKIKLIESDSFKDFVHTVADETFTIDKNKQIEILIDELLTQFKNQYSSSEIIELFSNCNETTTKYLSKKFTEEPIHRIEVQIEGCTKKRSKDKINANKFGTELYNNTKIDLITLKSILGNNNLQFKLLADNIAKELLQCSINYFNECLELEKSNDYLEEAMKLVKLAAKIAVNDATKKNIKESINTLKGMKDRELSEILLLLNSLKRTYEENDKKIRREVNDITKNDISFQYGLKTINWKAVEDNIKDSINWGNVNDLVSEILTDKNLKKIKFSDNIEAKKEFWELINWTKENSLKATTISRIIETYKNIPPKLCFEILSAEITNSEDKPLYIENIRLIGLKLKVNSTGTQKVIINKKYVNPEGKYINTSKSSLNGYSSTNEIILTPETKVINLDGFGNTKECTYIVGTHKIELYIDHFKVYSKTFQVDWSPTRKAELLKKIQQLENELREVEKFKWFRFPDTKQKEIAEAKAKIYRAKQTLLNK
jgi:hypothetical protein